MKYKNIAFFSGIKQFRRQRRLWLGRLVHAIVRGLGRSLRIVPVGLDRHDELLVRESPLIYAFWHGHQLALLYLHRGRRDVDVLVSQSEDGQLLFEVLRRAGLSAVRGSSSRGGAEALEELLTRVSAGQSVALAPDGPRGPRHSVARGVTALARWSGRPIMPVAIACANAWQLRSWDQFLIPWPGSRVAVGYGEPIWVGAEETDESAGRRLAQRLHELTAQLEEKVGRATPATDPAAAPSEAKSP